MTDTPRHEEWKALWERIEKLEAVPPKEVLFSDVREIAEETNRLLACTETTQQTIQVYKGVVQKLKPIERLTWDEEYAKTFKWRQGNINDLNALKFYVHMMWAPNQHILPPIKEHESEFTTHTIETYPPSVVNEPKSVKQATNDRRYWFFQSFFEKHKPELEGCFSNYIHDMGNDVSFCGHVASDFDVNDIKAAWMDGKITSDDVAFIFWRILHWIHYELLHTGPEHDEKIKNIFQSWNIDAMACKILVHGDIYTFDNCDDEIYGKDYENRVRARVKDLQENVKRRQKPV